MSLHQSSSPDFVLVPPFIVKAMKIASIDIDGHMVDVRDGGDRTVRVSVKESFFTREIPHEGDYLVQYSDGYISHRSSRELKEIGYF